MSVMGRQEREFNCLCSYTYVGTLGEILYVSMIATEGSIKENYYKQHSCAYQMLLAVVWG